MKRVLIWGTEKCYDKYLNALKYQELLGSINVVGVTSEYYSYEYVDGWPFVKSKDIYSLGFDVLVIAAEKEEDRFKKINDEAQKRGIKEENIIPMKVFAIPGFNIDKYLNLKSGGVFQLWRAIAGAV